MDYRAHPIAPAGIRVMVHLKPEIRDTWEPHAEEAFYLGPTLDHYRAYPVRLPETNSTRVSDTLQWFPVTVQLPGLSHAELLTAALDDFTTLLASMRP
jgi:hypothetical protein